MSIDKVITVDDKLTCGHLHRLVGCAGEFTDWQGRTRQCVVRGTDKHYRLFKIAYYNEEAGRKIENAWIGVEAFRPDSTPNDRLNRQHQHNRANDNMP